MLLIDPLIIFIQLEKLLGLQTKYNLEIS